MGEIYQEHLERALAETSRSHTAIAEKLALAVQELERCGVDLFEAEDKFHVLSFYIKDDQARACAESRRDWLRESALRLEQTLKAIK
jgi:hypothetical protein